MLATSEIIEGSLCTHEVALGTKAELAKLGLPELIGLSPDSLPAVGNDLSRQREEKHTPECFSN